MCDAMVHRGPDGDGLLVDGPVALGHRRLSILDLSDAGAQPMEHPSGRWVITYNGEIYNYVELRAELEQAGVEFRTATDTEVLLAAWAHWGPACLPRLNGMFAFALWDRTERVLHAARDRFGEKPFFYRDDPGRGFVFASEAKALFLDGDPRPAPNEELLHRFLARPHFRVEESSFFAGVHRLAPAHRLEVVDGRVRTFRWWEHPVVEGDLPGSEAEHVERVAALLEDSVRIRMRSDVPLGTCLSGGLDSSAVVGQVARALREAGSTERQVTFSAVFPGAPADETRFIDAMAEYAGVESHRVEPTMAGLLDDLPLLMHHQEEPFAGPSIHAEWKVMELAREAGVTVLLNGQGGDEVFGGYHFLFGDLWGTLATRGDDGALAGEMAAYDALHGPGRAAPLLEAALRDRGQEPRRGAMGRLRSAVRGLRGGSVPPVLSRAVTDAAAASAPVPAEDLRRALRTHQTRRVMQVLLRQADRSSMAFSREARLPLLDHRLVEYVDALPDDRKLRGGTTKWILREAIRGVVPETIRDRHDKVGFAVPVAGRLREDVEGRVRSVLLDRRTLERGLFSRRGLESAFVRLEAGDDGPGRSLWRAFLTETWFRECIEAWGHPA